MATTDDWSLFGSSEKEDDDVTVEVANKAIMALLNEKEELLKHLREKDGVIETVQAQLYQAEQMNSDLKSSTLDPDLKNANEKEVLSQEILNLKQEVQRLSLSLQSLQDKHKLVESELQATKIQLDHNSSGSSNPNGLSNDDSGLVDLYQNLQTFSTELQTKYEFDKNEWQGLIDNAEREAENLKSKVTIMEIFLASSEEKHSVLMADAESQHEQALFQAEEKLRAALARAQEANEEKEIQHEQALFQAEEKLRVALARALEANKEKEIQHAKLFSRRAQEANEEKEIQYKEALFQAEEKLHAALARAQEANKEEEIQIVKTYSMEIEKLKLGHEEKVIQMQKAFVQLQTQIVEAHSMEIEKMKLEQEEEVIQLQEAVVQLQTQIEEEQDAKVSSLTVLVQELTDQLKCNQEKYDKEQSENSEAMVLHIQESKDKLQKEHDTIEKLNGKLAIADSALMQSEKALVNSTEDNVVMEQQVSDLRERLQEVSQAAEASLSQITSTYEDTIADMNSQFQAQLLELAEQHKQEMAGAREQMEALLDQQTSSMEEIDSLHKARVKGIESSHTEQMTALGTKYEELLKEHNENLNVANHVMSRVQELEGADIMVEEIKEKYKEIQVMLKDLQHIKQLQDERLEEQESALQAWYCRKCFLTMEGEENA
eukprot:CAMPEP_0196598058 /NCGR_PEP_ID=MMETSP1081-20130531/94095_1 /TAXON_ID=36882 /ORGANISM="Pyramimonas amylifera, Strain CCMP720" /LENGTH=659 /DNA_ID=CAMNT_0041923689 /DNA_START=51 /DNA_END=2031 /DNA_ORIENTATION=+